MDPPRVPKFGSFSRRQVATQTAEQPVIRSNARHTKGRRHDHREGHSKNEKQCDSHSKDASDERSREPGRESHRPLGGENHNGRDRRRNERRTQSFQSADYQATGRQSSPSQDAVSEKSLKEPQVPDQASRTWMVDYTGDKQNLTFGSLHRYSVPEYHRYGGGKVVGMSSSLRMYPNESTAQQVSLAQPDRRYERRLRMLTSKGTRMLSGTDPSLLIPSIGRNSTFDLDNRSTLDTSIELQLADQRVATQMDMFEDAVDYHSLEAEVFITGDSVDDTVYRNSSTDPQLDNELAARKRNGILMRATKEHPTDFTAWKELADHQLNLYFPDRNLESLSAREQHRLDEMRSSIYDKALRSTLVSCPGREELTLLYLGLATRVEDECKVQRVWEAALAEYPDCSDLAADYAGYLQTTPTSDFERVSAAYHRAFATLKKRRDSSAVSVAGQQIHLLLRFTAFLRDACYDELALALWQCLLDLHSSTGSQYDDEDRLLAKMKTWWELDVARLGESNALPFARWLDNDKSSGCPVRSSCSTMDLRGTPHNSSEWLIEERKLHMEMRLPAAPDENSADPQRFVLWNDLQPIVSRLLFPLPGAQLLSAWLLYLGLPPLALDFGPSIEALVQWQSDDLFRTPLSVADSSLSDWTKSSQLGLKRTIVSSRLLFDSDSFVCLKQCKPLLANGLSDDFPRYVQRTLFTLIDAARADAESYTAIAEYLVAFTAHTFPDEVAKVSKKCIKGRPGNVKLYNAYASSLTLDNNTAQLEKARDIWLAALTNVSDFTRGAPVWRDWAWVEFRLGNDVMSLSILQNSTQEIPSPWREVAGLGKASANQRLRTIQFLRDAFERNLHNHNQVAAVACAEMIALFGYLVEDGDITAALDAVKMQLRYLERESEVFGASECVLQSLAELANVHMDRARHFRRGLLLDFVAGALAKHPHNSILLNLHYRLLHQNRVNDRLRLAANSIDIDVDYDGEVVWSHKIAEEIRRWHLQPPAGTPNSVRALFQHALCNSRSRARHSAHLWSAWLRFELSFVGETDRPSPSKTQASAAQKIRTVLYTGSRALPQNKKWLLGSMQEINSSQADLIGHEDIAQAVESFLSKGLRVRLTFPDR